MQRQLVSPMRRQPRVPEQQPLARQAASRPQNSTPPQSALAGRAQALAAVLSGRAVRGLALGTPPAVLETRGAPADVLGRRLGRGVAVEALGMVLLPPAALVALTAVGAGVKVALAGRGLVVAATPGVLAGRGLMPPAVVEAAPGVLAGRGLEVAAPGVLAGLAELSGLGLAVAPAAALGLGVGLLRDVVAGALRSGRRGRRGARRLVPVLLKPPTATCVRPLAPTVEEKRSWQLPSCTSRQPTSLTSAVKGPALGEVPAAELLFQRLAPPAPVSASVPVGVMHSWAGAEPGSAPAGLHLVLPSMPTRLSAAPSWAICRCKVMSGDASLTAAGMGPEVMQLTRGSPLLVSWCSQPCAALMLPVSFRLLQVTAPLASCTTSAPSSCGAQGAGAG
jgi:hypothetical protein